MAYTIEKIEAYGNRLHINTVLTILFNTLAGYLILRHSTSNMGIYKYYILSTVIFAFLMDFHVTFIYGLFPLYPYPGGCPAGISRYWGQFWGSAVQFGIFHFTLAFCGLSVFFGLVYQYYSITRKSDFLQTFRGGICVALFMLIYPLPSFVLYFLNHNSEEFLEQLKIQAPELIQFFIAAGCDGHFVIKSAKSYLAVCSLQILTVNISAFILVIKIVKELTAQKRRISPLTLKMRQQYFKVLTIQFFLPMIFMVFPLISIIVMILLNVKNIDVYTQICIQFMTLHSVANALTIMCVIKSYRRILFQWFTFFFKKDYIDPKWSNSVFALQ